MEKDEISLCNEKKPLRRNRESGRAHLRFLNMERSLHVDLASLSKLSTDMPTPATSVTLTSRLRARKTSDAATVKNL